MEPPIIPSLQTCGRFWQARNVFCKIERNITRLHRRLFSLNPLVSLPTTSFSRTDWRQWSLPSRGEPNRDSRQGWDTAPYYGIDSTYSLIYISMNRNQSKLHIFSKLCSDLEKKHVLLSSEPSPSTLTFSCSYHTLQVGCCTCRATFNRQ